MGAVTGDGLAGVETRWSVRRLFSTVTESRLASTLRIWLRIIFALGLMPFPIRKMASDSFRAADPVGVSFPRFPRMRLGLTPGFHGGRFIYPRHNPGHGIPEKMGAQSTAARLPHL